ncbi:MAG TPA: hypothetical protein VGH76_26255 [Actinomycetospora sp.]
MTIEVPLARTAVGYSSGDQMASVVFVIMVKNWNSAPRSRIQTVV